MRMGQDIGEYVDIPSMDGVRALMVPLTERETQKGLLYGAELEVPDNVSGIMARERAVKQSDVWHSLREMDNPDKKVFSTIEDMIGDDGLEPEDLDHLHQALATLMDYASPTLEGITAELWSELKKVLSGVELSELTGRQWAVVKLLCQHLAPQLLQARYSGSHSTEPLTPTNGDDAST
jgi:hypothetical protein